NGRQREVGFHSTVRPQVGQGTVGMAANRLTDYRPQLETGMPFVTTQSASSSCCSLSAVVCRRASVLAQLHTVSRNCTSSVVCTGRTLTSVQFKKRMLQRW